MQDHKPSWSDRIYAALLALLPLQFRTEFGGDMEEVFREQRVHTEQAGNKWALATMWWATIRDIVRMAPREHLSVLIQDTRYALRMMARDPGYTFVAVAILGLGIGANTAIFSMVNAVLLQPLPYVRGDRLVMLHQRATKVDSDMQFSVKEIDDYRRQASSLSEVAEFHSMQFTLLNRGEATRVRSGVVSAGFFELFGVKPLMGRTFVADDDKLGAPAVLLVSYEFWKQNQHGDPAILGKRFEMNDRVHTVIGVLPPIPQYPSENDVYMPTSACPFRSSQAMISNRNSRMMDVFGRMKTGVTVDQNRAELAGIGRRLEQAYAESYPKGLGYTIESKDLKTEITQRARPMLLVLLGAAAFVLLIACANVANLILARMARRERELMIRTAVGAGGGRLLRQLLTESLIMALLASAAGLLFATGSLHLLTEFAGQLTPRAREISLNGWVLGFAVLCATVTSVVFGSIAALTSRTEISAGVKEGRSRLRSALIVAQVAFSVVLLIGATLMVRSLMKLESVNPGFVPQHVFGAGINLNWSKHSTPQQRLLISRRLLDAIQSQPGVLSAAISSSFPLDPDAASMGGWIQDFRIEGEVRSDSEAPKVASMRVGSPGYFRTLGIPLVSGRVFTDADNEKAPDVAVISQALARRRWHEKNPIGRKITFDGEHWLQVVGVVGDVKEFSLDRDAPEQIYRPLAQLPAVGSVLVRTAGSPSAISSQIRRAVLSVDPQTAFTREGTLEQAREESFSSSRTTTYLFELFGALALIIAVTGVGSMLALTVRQRTRELGLRMAFGARPWDVLRLVLGQGIQLVLFGMVAGLAAGYGLTRLLKSLLFQIEPTDPATFGLACVVLLGAAMIACWIPARRAAHIDPQEALRSE